MLLQKVFEILENAKETTDIIKEVRYSPKKDFLVVDVNYNKALTVIVKGTTVHVQGDLSAGEAVKKIIEGALKYGN